MQVNHYQIFKQNNVTISIYVFEIKTSNFLKLNCHEPAFFFVVIYERFYTSVLCQFNFTKPAELKLKMVQNYLPMLSVIQAIQL